MNRIRCKKVEYILCECGCGEQLNKYNVWGYERKFIHGHNPTKHRDYSGDNNPCWRGGETLGSDGYLMIRINGKYIRKHRYIYEQFHKVCVLPYIVVHHKNGNKLDNRIENLITMTHEEHARYEAIRYWSHVNTV